MARNAKLLRLEFGWIYVRSMKQLPLTLFLTGFLTPCPLSMDGQPKHDGLKRFQAPCNTLPAQVVLLHMCDCRFSLYSCSLLALSPSHLSIWLFLSLPVSHSFSTPISPSLSLPPHCMVQSRSIIRFLPLPHLSISLPPSLSLSCLFLPLPPSLAPSLPL